jgi:PPOX class probable F420-dependent enzyme
MPGYGVRPASEGTGLLPWSWAVERLTASHDYWLATVHPDGRPHLAPVWGAWTDDALWFSTSAPSRKGRNLRHAPRCSLATDDPRQPVVLHGAAVERPSAQDRERFLAALNAKYAVSYGLDFLDGVENLCFSVQPETVVGLLEQDFTGSPTRWTFG